MLMQSWNIEIEKRKKLEEELKMKEDECYDLKMKIDEMEVNLEEEKEWIDDIIFKNRFCNFILIVNFLNFNDIE